MTAATAKCVDYIVNSKKPFPDWIKTHPVFKQSNKIEKVFPRIGLPNFKEECEIMNTAEATISAQMLGNELINQLRTAKNNLYNTLNTALQSKEANRNERCNRLQRVINSIANVDYSMSYNDYVSTANGSVSLRLRADIFAGDSDKNPLFHKDEAITRIYGKLREACNEHNVKLNELEQLPSFKTFSRVNVPNNKYTIVFSSVGEDGAWDIATISMRGITSCQQWGSVQSRGLIGSISSKFVGVLYIASNQDIPGYGSKMMNRSLVRFAINRNTKRPGLVIDRMYPQENKDTVNVFKKTLHNKTGLDVIYVGDNNYGGALEYYIPDEPHNKLFQPGETSYMDTKLPTLQHAQIVKKPAEIVGKLTETFRARVITELANMIRMKLEILAPAQEKHKAMRAEYDAAKAKWLESYSSKSAGDRPKFGLSPPKMDPELQLFGSGGGALNFPGLIAHCDKRHGANSAASLFANFILNSIEVPNAAEFSANEQYHRKYLMSFLRNPSAIKAAGWRAASQGTWMKCFSKSAEKFFYFVFEQVKTAITVEIKSLIKKSNESKSNIPTETPPKTSTISDIDILSGRA